jgi:hypothetical protein
VSPHPPPQNSQNSNEYSHDNFPRSQKKPTFQNCLMCSRLSCEPYRKRKQEPEEKRPVLALCKNKDKPTDGYYVGKHASCYHVRGEEKLRRGVSGRLSIQTLKKSRKCCWKRNCERVIPHLLSCPYRLKICLFLRARECLYKKPKSKIVVCNRKFTKCCSKLSCLPVRFGRRRSLQ